MNRPLFIFDLDGTLALIDHRRPILDDLNNPNRWDDFYEACDKDKPNKPVIKIFNIFRFLNFETWIFSGRSERVREKTLKWLANYTSFYDKDHYTKLIMRPNEDYTPDEELKKSWYDNMLDEDKKRLVCIFDDRNKVVNMWRSLGITCLQVANGEF